MTRHRQTDFSSDNGSRLRAQLEAVPYELLLQQGWDPVGDRIACPTCQQLRTDRWTLTESEFRLLLRIWLVQDPNQEPVLLEENELDAGRHLESLGFLRLELRPASRDTSTPPRRRHYARVVPEPAESLISEVTRRF